ncbi:hypothetical protein KBZ21_39725, partial [Streptomyces sp. A73]|nr:hypothetical protein [Streptomyces sp. A73]
AWHTARRWLDNQYRGGRPGSPTVQTWRSTQLFDALRPEGDDPRYAQIWYAVDELRHDIRGPIAPHAVHKRLLKMRAEGRIPG